MISVSTLAFALASLALLAAAGALLTLFQLAKDMDSQRLNDAQAWKNHAASIERVKQAVSARLAELDRRSPAKDAAAVADLREAVESLKATQQRFAGRFYKQIQIDGGGGDAPQFPQQPQLNGIDPELAAEIALQTAAPVAPGRS